MASAQTRLQPAVVPAGAITFALRALPFAAIEPLRASRLARELSARMPAGLMLILVVYCCAMCRARRQLPRR